MYQVLGLYPKIQIIDRLKIPWKQLNNIITKFIKKVDRFFHQFYRVPYCVPAWGWGEHSAILKCILTGSVVNGKSKAKLYEQIRKQTGLKHVIGFNSGQEAICAALIAWGIKKGDRVIMPSYCCETVAMAVLDSGADIIFCDIGGDLNPDVSHILSLVSPEVKAVIFPHLFGNPGSIDRLEKGLEGTGLRSDILVIDDAAQSFGAQLNGRLLGTFGDAGIISFGPGKTMTAAGGGLLITDSARISEALSALSMSRVSLSEKLKRLFYWVIFRRWRRFTLPFLPLFSRFLGSNNRDKNKPAMLCNVDAAIAIEQLKNLDGFIATRIKRKGLLDNSIGKYGASSLCLMPENSSDSRSVNVATKYLLRLKGNEHAREIPGLYSLEIERLGIEILPLYTPIHLKPEYSHYSVSLPETETAYKKILQIPVEPSMSDRVFSKIINGFAFFREGLDQKRIIDPNGLQSDTLLKRNEVVK
jgi:dTDP-4-amino-4,6-dideoxygalactose transaminase